MSTTTDFQSIDFGVSQEHPTIMQTIIVTVNPSSLLSDYAKAFVEEAYRLNYDKAKMVDLKAEEVFNYLSYLLTKRLQVVEGSCPDFRNLKLLMIPAYFQYVLTLIGVCEDRQIGLKFVPNLSSKSEMTFEDAVSVSEKIASFEDELQLVHDAMPRDIAGDINFMSTALIGEYVAACRKLDHPMVTYCTAFMDMKLQEEATYGVLYRRLYGDKNVIAQALIAEKRKLL